MENAILSRHTTLWISRMNEEGQPDNEWISVGRLTNIPMPSPETEEIDISALDSPGTAKEFIAGPTDNGSMELVGQYKAGEEGQRFLMELYQTKETFRFRIQAPWQNGVVKAAQYEGTAYVSSCKPFGDASEGDILPFNATLRVTGDLDYEREYIEGEKAPEVDSNFPEEFTFEDAINVRLFSEIGDREIYYTTNGQNPTKESTHYNPEEGIDITETTTLKVINIPDRLEASDIRTFEFTKES